MMDWQPIDTAPKDGRDVILFVCKIKPDFGIARWNGSFWDQFDIDAECDGDRFLREFGVPTHWQPLPAPPTD